LTFPEAECTVEPLIPLSQSWWVADSRRPLSQESYWWADCRHGHDFTRRGWAYSGRPGYCRWSGLSQYLLGNRSDGGSNYNYSASLVEENGESTGQHQRASRES